MGKVERNNGSKAGPNFETNQHPVLSFLWVKKSTEEPWDNPPVSLDSLVLS